jgi:hypothetical protein
MNTNDLANFKNFVSFPVNLRGFTDENGKVSKEKSNFPTGWNTITKSNKSSYVETKWGGNIKPNGIAVVLKPSGLSAIDVDEPDNCRILERLKADCGFVVQTRKGFHFYFKQEEIVPRQKQCGIADINTNLLYYVPTYTHRDTGEEYHYTLIKNTGLNDMPQYAIDWCLDLIAMKEKKDVKSVMLKKKKTTKEEIVIRPNLEVEKFDLKVIKTILELLYEVKFMENYQGWRDTAYMIRHLNNSEESYKLFDKYSKLVADYKCGVTPPNDTRPPYKKKKSLEKYKNKTRSMFYGNGEYNLNFDENMVLVKCGRLNFEKYKTCLQYLYKGKWENDLIHFNLQYIYPDDNTNDIMFDDWYKNYKCLGIRSAYGTGKSYAFKKLIQKYGFNRVLFITYRQSLAHSLILELREKFGFISYLDEDANILEANKLIIQLDSIKKLGILGGYNLFTQEDGMPKYDLIVLDEIEGTLNHLSFKNLDQYSIHNYLVRLINKAPKILALDGDMSDRSYDFVSDLCPSYKFYMNDYKPNKKHFVFTHTIKTLYEAIDSDLSQGRKIVVASMTLSDTNRLKEMYEGKYKVIIHNSIERNKAILMNVNEEWNKCDLLVYSPAVESGVDFTIRKYFYRCYGILESDSTSYRAFSQMLNRVRYFEKDEVLCLMPEKMNYKVNEILFRYDEMKMKYHGVEISNLIDILIHNDTERQNSENYFMCAFINLLNSKGHTHQYLNDKPKPRTQRHEITGKEHSILAMMKAKNITDDEASMLGLQKQKQKIELTIEQNYSLEKYWYAKNFKTDITELNVKWLDDRYYKKDIPKMFDWFNNKYIPQMTDNTILKNKEQEKMNEMRRILKHIGFEINKEGIVGESIPYEKAFAFIKETLYTKNFKITFGTEREVKEKNVLSIFNKVLNNYGYELAKKTKLGKRLETGREVINSYNLFQMDIMIDYVEKSKIEFEKLLKQQQEF